MEEEEQILKDKLDNLSFIKLLAQYKVGFFKGSCITEFEFQQDFVYEIAEKMNSVTHNETFYLLLIPRDSKITEVSGEGWDEQNAFNCAKVPDSFPSGSILLKGKLNQELEIVEEF